MLMLIEKRNGWDWKTHQVPVGEGMEFEISSRSTGYGQLWLKSVISDKNDVSSTHFSQPTFDLLWAHSHSFRA